MGRRKRGKNKADLVENRCDRVSARHPLLIPEVHFGRDVWWLKSPRTLLPRLHFLQSGAPGVLACLRPNLGCSLCADTTCVTYSSKSALGNLKSPATASSRLQPPANLNDC